MLSVGASARRQGLLRPFRLLSGISASASALTVAGFSLAPMRSKKGGDGGDAGRKTANPVGVRGAAQC